MDTFTQSGRKMSRKETPNETDHLGPQFSETHEKQISKKLTRER